MRDLIPDTLPEYERNLFNLAITQRGLVSSYVKINNQVEALRLRKDACENAAWANRLRKSRMAKEEKQ